MMATTSTVLVTLATEPFKFSGHEERLPDSKPELLTSPSGEFSMAIT
jgi:hypothetical protein